jgi:TonB family protein
VVVANRSERKKSHPGGKMRFFRQLSLLGISVCLLHGLAFAQTGKEAQAEKQETFSNQSLPKAFACPMPSVFGNVALRVVIDAKGTVSEAKALGGPEGLFALAEACARTWKYENPPSAPATKTVLLRYEWRDCPAAESQRGELQFSWGLRDRFNHPVAYIQGQKPPSPVYPDEDRKAGIAGAMVLSVPLNADGSVKDIRVMRGLSLSLDKAVMDQLRPLKFKIADGTSETQLEDARFQIVFHATCAVQIVSNDD